MIEFNDFKYHCKHGHDSYDENRNLTWTCHHKSNKPDGCSWGYCDEAVCPIVKLSKLKGE